MKTLQFGASNCNLVDPFYFWRLAPGAFSVTSSLLRHLLSRIFESFRGCSPGQTFSVGLQRAEDGMRHTRNKLVELPKGHHVQW